MIQYLGGIFHTIVKQLLANESTHDPRMRLTLKDMAAHMPKSRLENPHTPLRDVRDARA